MRTRRWPACFWPVVPVLVLLASLCQAESRAGKVSDARKDADGFLVHTVESEFQKGQTAIKVLLPDRLEKGRRYPVLYILPVEAGDGARYGNGLLEAKRLDLANKHGLICVLPTFSHLPWYADHPSDAQIRQESYFLRVVVPFVERQYPALAEQKGRLLLGFSKSGWGAFCLLLRHPATFGRAVAWDAPLNQARPDKFGMGPIFGTAENFEKYRVPKLLEQRAAELGKEKRLAIAGYANFRDHHRAVHDLMVRLAIPHDYRDRAQEKHTWEAGWMGDAVQFLVAAPREDR